ncbi:MAG: nickel pincer cofactor biosynthesis protein LarC [Caloramator sp.]|nr:nickel pincer cofactor biosynthesis protein LarC [Caloramator sp.]
MRILYFDCFSGISGDMAVASLIDLGVSKEYLLNELKKLNIDEEYKIEIKRVKKAGIDATRFDVILTEHRHHSRNLFDIEGIIDKSELNKSVKELSKRIFKIVGEAEAKVHGEKLYDVHFHEVGATDSIIDIVAFSICLDYLKIDKVISSYINTGRGFVECEHGMLPVPAPATAEILKGIPVYSDEREFELTTPTGAAIIKAVANEFKMDCPLVIKNVGYGAGKRETEKPNVLRAILSDDDYDEIYLIQANIDDMTGEMYGYLMDKLLEAGAKDVYYTPIYMKKNRPAVVLNVIVSKSMEEKILDIIFTESTTIGVRKIKIDRVELERETKTVETRYGDINVKVARYKDKVVNIKPEFEDLKRIAEENNIPLKSATQVKCEINHNL